MLRVDLDYLYRNNLTEYKDEHLAFINDAVHLSALLGQGGMKTDFVLCIICLQGKLQVSVDNVSLTLCRHQALVCPVNSIVRDYLSDPHIHAFAICVNPNILKDLHLNKQRWEYYQFILRNHIINFTPADWSRFVHYHKLMSENLSDTRKKFHKQIVHSLWQSIIYEFVSMIDRHITHVQPVMGKSVNSDLLNSRFMEMLAQSEGRIHTVAEFAARLFVTPKHLSMSVKQATGKTALRWIHESMAKEIERLLHHSEWSLKEIARQMNFPNTSFFGKFVKTHLGDTPLNIRNRGNNT